MTQPKTKQKKDARDLRAEALKIARSVHIEGQTAAETKTIANGIQRGIELFMRQQSEKARDLDKRTKKVKQLANQLAQQQPAETADAEEKTQRPQILPWVLLGASWILFALVWLLR